MNSQSILNIDGIDLKARTSVGRCVDAASKELTQGTSDRHMWSKHSNTWVNNFSLVYSIGVQ